MSELGPSPFRMMGRMLLGLIRFNMNRTLRALPVLAAMSLAIQSGCADEAVPGPSFFDNDGGLPYVPDEEDPEPGPQEPWENPGTNPPSNPWTPPAAGDDDAGSPPPTGGETTPDGGAAPGLGDWLDDLFGGADAGTPPPDTTPADPNDEVIPGREPDATNIPECPKRAPENPIGSCIGVPIYASCGYSGYNCICDWYHWLCL
jgi:hypothetical protein